MTLERAIHDRWAADAALAALLPPERLTTGRASAGPRPYAALSLRRSRAALRSNAGDSVDETEAWIDVWHDDYDAGRAIVQRVKAVFDRAALDLAGGGRAVQVRRTDDFAAQDEEGVWQFTVRLVAHVHYPS